MENQTINENHTLRVAKTRACERWEEQQLTKTQDANVYELREETRDRNNTKEVGPQTMVATSQTENIINGKNQRKDTYYYLDFRNPTISSCEPQGYILSKTGGMA
ncbi:hypothetical protein V493_00294 [Pseudogymnoascus sp. VKM F-4281 (FW-2241)]|nr:hypothetical protein V493_00294 [Pseudogymnoascus sp. VKM F-4281 (FW-2241)]